MLFIRWASDDYFHRGAMGFAGVLDVVRLLAMEWARGSAVGSLVVYALEITGIDPVKTPTFFERFLKFGNADHA